MPSKVITNLSSWLINTRLYFTVFFFHPGLPITLFRFTFFLHPGGCDSNWFHPGLEFTVLPAGTGIRSLVIRGWNSQSFHFRDWNSDSSSIRGLNSFRPRLQWNSYSTSIRGLNSPSFRPGLEFTYFLSQLNGWYTVDRDWLTSEVGNEANKLCRKNSSLLEQAGGSSMCMQGSR